MKDRPSGARRMPRVVQSLRKPFTNLLACFKRRPFSEGPAAGLSDIWPEDIPSIQDLMGLQYEGAPEAVPVFDLRLASRNEDASLLAYASKDWEASDPYAEQQQLAALSEQLYYEQYSAYTAESILQQRTQRISVLEASVQQLGNQAADTAFTNATLQSDLATLQQNLQEAERMLNEATAEVESERTARLAAEQTTVQAVAAVQTDAAYACSVLGQQSASRRTALLLQRQRRQQTETQLQSMTAARDAAEIRATQAVATASTAQAAVADLRTELASSQALLSVSQASKQATIQQLDQAVACGRQLDQQLADARAAQTASEAEHLQAQQALRSELTAVQSELAQSKEALDLGQAKEALSAHDLQDATSGAAQLRADLQSVLTDLAVAQQQNVNLSQDLAASQTEHANALERQQQSASAADQLRAELQATKGQLSTALQQLEKASVDLAASRAEQVRTLEQSDSTATQLQAQLNSAQTERQSAWTSLAQVQQTLEQTQQQLRELQGKQAVTEEQLVSSQAAMKTLAVANTKLEASKAKLSQQLAASQAQQEQTLERMNQATKKSSELETQLATAKADRDSALDGSAQLQQTLEQTKGQVSGLEHSKAAVQQQLDVSQAACGNLKALNSQLEASATELTQKLQASEAEKQTSSDLAAERQNLLAGAQTQLRSVNGQQKASAEKVKELQQQLESAQLSNKLLDQQKASVATQLKHQGTKHAAVDKTLERLRLQISSVKERSVVKEAEAAASRKQHIGSIAALQKTLEAERLSTQTLTSTQQSQQQADSETIRQLKAALGDAQMSIKAKAEQADAAAKAQASAHTRLRSDLAASHEQLNTSHREHEYDLAEIRRLQIELQDAKETAALSTTTHEATIAALQKDLSRPNQPMPPTKTVTRAPSPPPGFGAPSQKAGGSQQGPLSVRTKAVQEYKPYIPDSSSQAYQPPGLPKVGQAKPTGVSDGAQNSAAQELLKSSSLSSMASSSSLGPATPHETVVTAFNRPRPHPGKYDPCGHSETAGQASSVAANNVASGSSVPLAPVQSAAPAAPSRDRKRPLYQPPFDPLHAKAACSGAHGSSTGRGSGSHTDQPTPAGVSDETADPAQVSNSAISEAAAAAARAVNGLNRGSNLAIGSASSSTAQRSSRAAGNSASQSSHQRRDGSTGHADRRERTADAPLLPPGLQAQAGTLAAARGPSSFAAAAASNRGNSRLSATAQGNDAQPRQSQQARQRAALQGPVVLSEDQQRYLRTVHVKPLVGPVVAVDNSLADDTHNLLCKIARLQHWQYYTDVRGDGNCGYRAVGLGLVVAVAGLQPAIRHQFTQHLEQLWSRMQHFPRMLTCCSPTQGSVKMGYYALLEALQHEPKFRRIMDGGSAAPSQQLISEWNKHSVSDAVVLFLRAVTAVHILQHPGFHQDNYMVDMADIKGVEDLEDACFQFLVPFCNGSTDKYVDQRSADAHCTLIALAEALEMDILVQPGKGNAINVNNICEQQHHAPWRTQICLIGKPDHFTVAWA